jgi:hypothetical protein
MIDCTEFLKNCRPAQAALAGWKEIFATAPENAGNPWEQAASHSSYP